MTVKAGVLTGEVVDLKVIESVEQGTDRVISPARLTGSVRLENTSVNRTVRLAEGQVRFMDVYGRPIELEGDRIETIMRFTPQADRLDPGQDTTRALEVEFPVEALKAERLKEIRLELAYIPSPFRQEIVNFVVSIGAGRGRKDRLMTRFVQLCASQNNLFALDEDGNVYQYHFNVRTWVRLAPTRDQSEERAAS
jgi:hypothetical protein